jgi:hypothetical protein
MAAAREASKETKELRDAIKKIEPFFRPMGKPGNSDWLASHNGQRTLMSVSIPSH